LRIAIVRIFTLWHEHFAVALRSAREFGISSYQSADICSQLLLNCYTVAVPRPPTSSLRLRCHPPASGIRNVVLEIKRGIRIVAQSNQVSAVADGPVRPAASRASCCRQIGSLDKVAVDRRKQCQLSSTDDHGPVYHTQRPSSSS